MIRADRTEENPTAAAGATVPHRLGIVFAVRNEARWLDALLESIRMQEGLGDVCCIAAVDGRSEDDSRGILERWKGRLAPLRILDNAARIAPVAFNIGIRACLDAGADGVILVSGHSELRGGFLAEAQRVLGDPGAAIVGCVLDYPPPRTSFERAAQAFVESRLGRRMGAFSKLARMQETEIATFPVIRRDVFERIGFFDESMIRNQDIEFTARAREAGLRVLTSPALRCRYSPRVTFSGLVAQMYGNGLWVGRRPRVHGLRHLAPAIFFGGLLAAIGLSILIGWPWSIVAAALAGAYLVGIGLASLGWLPRAGLGALFLPILFPAAHGAYAAGTFRGFFSSRRSLGMPGA